MAEVSESPFLRGDVPRINSEPEQNSNERENQNTLEQIETNPDQGLADDRVELSEEARRQDALGSGIEGFAPNETETEATLTPNAPIPEEQDIREVGEPNSLGNAPGANQAANFSIEQRVPQETEVSGDLSGRQELGSGVELREELGAQGAQVEKTQNTIQDRFRENAENQATEPRQGISETAARESERDKILETPRQNAGLERTQQPVNQETTQTDQVGRIEEVRPAQQEEIDSQANEQQQDRQDISRQEDRNQDPVSAQTQIGRNVDDLI